MHVRTGAFRVIRVPALVQAGLPDVRRAYRRQCARHRLRGVVAEGDVEAAPWRRRPGARCLTQWAGTGP